MFKEVDIENIGNVTCLTEERETTINFGYSDKEASIYTSDNTVITKIKKCINKDPKQWKCFIYMKNEEGSVTGYLFKTNKNNIKFKTLNSSKKKEYTEEERKAMGARLHKNRKKDDTVI